MLKAKIPENENARLQDLHNSGLLDTPQETEFDDIVKLASLLCDMPISLISLVDSNRQFFKARVGFDATETSRDVSFCGHAILQDDLFEISDATKDSRFSDNPLVLGEPTIRFYAGIPLVTSTGSRIGTLCVIDKMPGHLTEPQRFGLKVLANNVIKIAELRIKNKELSHFTETQKKTISILAHDVRNPLASIKSIIELKKSEVLSTEESTEMMDIVSGQLDSTIAMVENVVNWGQLQLQFGQLQLNDFNLHELVERIFGSELLKSKAKGNMLINEVDPDLIIHSDEHALEFILRNLLSNADKFTNGGNIIVKAESSGLTTTICVNDSGVGMTERQIANLLRDDMNATTLGTNREKGSGLGLMLAKEYIDRMNGKLTIESELNKGSCFKVKI